MNPPKAPIETPITPRMLTLKQAAAYTNASIWAIRDLIYADTIPHIAIGRRYLIDRGDLDRWLDIELGKSAQKAKSVAARVARTVGVR